MLLKLSFFFAFCPLATGRALSPHWLHRHQLVAPRRAGRRFLQSVRHLRTVDKGRQERDKVGATIMLFVRRQRCPASASRSSLRSRQLHADADVEIYPDNGCQDTKNIEPHLSLGCDLSIAALAASFMAFVALAGLRITLICAPRGRYRRNVCYGIFDFPISD